MAYCPLTLQGIASSCDTNMGGVRKVYIASFQDDIFSLDADGVVSAITTSVTWYEYALKQGVASMTGERTIDNSIGNNFATNSVVLQFAKMDAAKLKEVEQLCNGDAAVIVQDNNKKYWALGINNPANASASNAQTGQAATDGNFYAVTLSCADGSYPHEISATAIASMTVYDGE
jgi:hypothetical protein